MFLPVQQLPSTLAQLRPASNGRSVPHILWPRPLPGLTRAPSPPSPFCTTHYSLLLSPQPPLLLIEALTRVLLHPGTLQQHRLVANHALVLNLQHQVSHRCCEEKAKHIARAVHTASGAEGFQAAASSCCSVPPPNHCSATQPQRTVQERSRQPWPMVTLWPMVVAAGRPVGTELRGRKQGSEESMSGVREQQISSSIAGGAWAWPD